MKSHTHERDLALVYIAFVLAAVLWFTYLLNRMPHNPPSPPILSNRIRDACPPTPQQHRDRGI